MFGVCRVSVCEFAVRNIIIFPLCFLAAPNACEPGAETGTTIPDASTTTGAPLGPCVSPVDYYIGEGHCDPENNNAECYYDGGDCCPPHGQNWDFYCKATDVRMLGFFCICNRCKSRFYISCVVLRLS